MIANCFVIVRLRVPENIIRNAMSFYTFLLCFHLKVSSLSLTSLRQMLQPPSGCSTCIMASLRSLGEPNPNSKVPVLHSPLPRGTTTVMRVYAWQHSILQSAFVELLLRRTKSVSSLIVCFDTLELEFNIHSVCLEEEFFYSCFAMIPVLFIDFLLCVIHQLSIITLYVLFMNSAESY